MRADERSDGVILPPVRLGDLGHGRPVFPAQKFQNGLCLAAPARDLDFFLDSAAAVVIFFVAGSIPRCRRFRVRAPFEVRAAFLQPSFFVGAFGPAPLLPQLKSRR